MSRIRNKERNKLACALEIRDYRSLAATMTYLGREVPPQAAYVTSIMPQKLSKLTVQHPIDANAMVNDSFTFLSQITYPRLLDVENLILATSLDASHL